LAVNNLLVSFFLWILYRFDTLRTQDKEPFKDYTLSTKTLTFEIVLGLIDSRDNRDGNFFRELHLLAVNCVGDLDLLSEHKRWVPFLDFGPLHMLECLLHVV